jgi:hypothetical protein
MDMRTHNRFHLFPEQEITWMDSKGLPNREPSRVRGFWKNQDQFDKKEEKWYFSNPDLIAIVKNRKYYYCDKCGAGIKVERSAITRRVLSQDYYIGFSDLGSCYPPMWGYDYKMCIPCALEVFKDVLVYECPHWCFGSWEKTTLQITKPSIRLVDRINQLVKEKTP